MGSTGYALAAPTLDEVFSQARRLCRWQDGFVTLSRVGLTFSWFKRYATAVPDPTLILLHGNAGEGAAERLVARAQLASAARAARAARAGGFARVVLATDDQTATPPKDGAYEVDLDAPGVAFSLRERLCELVEHSHSGDIAVMGAGALPLLEAEDFAGVIEGLDRGRSVVVTNNRYSSDITAWTPPVAIERVGAFDRDNALARRLRDDAGCEVVTLPRSLRTVFDLDTPADLAVLALSEATPAPLPPPETLPLAPYRGVMPLLCDPDAEIVLAGRVGSATWQHLERETACRVRLYSEERGLASAPPSHVPRSLLGRLLDEVGPQRFAAELASLGDAVVLDTRVLLAHAGSAATREDRFQSDLLSPDRICDPWLRDLTAALAAASVPVLLGGHSLVSGGLMALADQAWLENDRRLEAEQADSSRPR